MFWLHLIMAGQPCAPTFICDNVIPALELCDITISLQELVLLTSENILTIIWLACHGLIANHLVCETCNINMSFQRREGRDFINGYCWSCKTCQHQRNLLINSFFKGSHFTLTGGQCSSHKSMLQDKQMCQPNL